MPVEPSADSAAASSGLPRVRGGSDALVAYLLLGLMCLMLVATEGWHEWTGRATQVEEVQTASANLAHSLMQEAEGAIVAADTALVAIVEGLEAEGSGPEALSRVAHLLAVSSANQPTLRGFSIDGRDGTRLLTSVPNLPLGVSNADRAYFRRHRDDPDRGPFVGPPTRSQLNGEWIVTISRRFQDLNGDFAGVVVTSVTSASVAGVYSTFDVGAAGSIALLHTNGTIMTRHPFDDAVIGRSLADTPAVQRAQSEPSGHFRTVSPIDGVERLLTYQRGERFPLILTVATGAEEALADWVRGAWFRIASVAAVTGAILFLGLRLIAQVRRRREAEVVLARSEAQFRMLAEHASDMVSRVGADGLRHYASPAAKRLLGIDPSELIGRRPGDHIHPEDRAEFEALVASLGQSQEQGGLVYRAYRADGTEIWIESTLRLVRDPRTGAADGYVGISRDVTVSKEMEAQLAALAATDGLTGIANRRHFDEELFAEWRRAAREGTSLAVMLLDVDHFKRFNDRYGHPAGDDCLRRVASTIAATIRRPGDRPARYGGEEFAVILPATDLAGAMDVADRVRAGIQAMAIVHEGNEAGVVTASIGVAVVSPVAKLGIATSALLEAADGALYEAKRTGRNRVVSAPELDPAALTPPSEAGS